MAKYKLLIAYEGTYYVGWQIQKSGISIQGEIARVLSIILRKKISIVGAGRTDAGVHALGQVAHFLSEENDIEKTVYAANALLPKDIRIIKGERAEEAFHARYGAISKTYHYRLFLGPVQLPFERNFSLHVKRGLDLALLKEAAACFIGTRDFRSFANEQNRGCALHKPVKTLKRLDLVQEGDILSLEFEGDGFLYKMVRNLTGTLLEAALGKLPVASLKDILQQKDRKLAPACAPAHGLFLMKVEY